MPRELSNFRGGFAPRGITIVEGNAMQNPATFRAYAEECKRLANRMPDHKDALLEMAQAGLACAERAEQKGNKHTPVDTGGRI